MVRSPASIRLSRRDIAIGLLIAALAFALRLVIIVDRAHEAGATRLRSRIDDAARAAGDGVDFPQRIRAALPGAGAPVTTAAPHSAPATDAAADRVRGERRTRWERTSFTAVG